MIDLLDRIIRWSFYILFFAVPLFFVGNTSELFEFNKMWLTFGLAIVIGFAWISKMILEKKFFIQKTLLDIPIGLFLLSQIISTIFSLDSRVSLWGYYSRFNGGLLSLITYIFLYYALLSNLKIKDFIKKLLHINLLSGLVVSLWGLPSHFGYDPTCLIFRGTLDVGCWTTAFQPKVRIFSTLGQPDWLAAYLAVLLPIAIAFGIYYAKQQNKKLAYYSLFLSILFYVDLLYTRSRSGFAGGVIAAAFLIGYHLLREKKTLSLNMFKETVTKHWFVSILIAAFIVLTFFITSPFAQLDIFTFSGIQAKIASLSSHKTAAKQTPAPSSTFNTGELGGTDSGTIRLLVWQGAIKAFMAHPIFGTGVETFAFAYYLYRPTAHNLTSEWNYLYNKAHNEYLNYLATTGAFGLLTYLSIIGLFLWTIVKRLRDSMSEENLITASLAAAYIGILVTNFFGFSVVIINVLLFIIPGFVFVLEDILPKEFIFPKNQEKTYGTSPFQWIGILAVGILSLYFLYYLYNFWNADVSYAYGKNLDGAGQYQQAYLPLHNAVEALPSEPEYQDELSYNDAVLAQAFFQNKDATTAARLAQEAVTVSNNVVATHPNNVTFWKTRVRTFYQLSQIDPKYLSFALEAIQKAHSLAPTDALISYNLGLLYGQTGNLGIAISTLQDTIKLKRDYVDAYYALGLYYRAEAVNKSNQVVNPEMEKNAVNTIHFILNNLDPKNLPALQALKSWKEQ